MVASCSAASTSSQSPATPDMLCIRNLRPKLAAKPIAAPASAAPTNAPPPLLPQEKALSSPPLLRFRVDARPLPELSLRFAVAERFEVRLELRFWVRVAMRSSVFRVRGFNGRL